MSASITYRDYNSANIELRDITWAKIKRNGPKWNETKRDGPSLETTKWTETVGKDSNGHCPDTTKRTEMDDVEMTMRGENFQS